VKKGNETKPGDLTLFFAAISFAVLNMISLRTNIHLFSYLSAIPAIFLVVAVFDRIAE